MPAPIYPTDYEKKTCMLQIKKKFIWYLKFFGEKMTFPSSRNLDDTLLLFIDFCGGTIKSNQSYEPLAAYFSLTRSDLAEKTPDGKHERWSNAIQWSRRRSVDDGFILERHSLARGYWRLSQKGIQHAERIKPVLGIEALTRLQVVAQPIKDNWTKPFEL